MKIQSHIPQKYGRGAKSMNIAHSIPTAWAQKNNLWLIGYIRPMMLTPETDAQRPEATAGSSEAWGRHNL